MTITGTTSEAQLRTLDDVAALPKHKRPTPAQRSQITTLFVKAYKGGASIRGLAEQSGRSFGYVHRVITEAAAAGRVTLRGRGKAKRQPANI